MCVYVYWCRNVIYVVWYNLISKRNKLLNNYVEGGGGGGSGASSTHIMTGVLQHSIINFFIFFIIFIYWGVFSMNFFLPCLHLNLFFLLFDDFFTLSSAKLPYNLMSKTIAKKNQKKFVMCGYV